MIRMSKHRCYSAYTYKKKPLWKEAAEIDAVKGQIGRNQRAVDKDANRAADKATAAASKVVHKKLSEAAKSRVVGASFADVNSFPDIIVAEHVDEHGDHKMARINVKEGWSPNDAETKEPAVICFEAYPMHEKAVTALEEFADRFQAVDQSC